MFGGRRRGLWDRDEAGERGGLSERDISERTEGETNVCSSFRSASSALTTLLRLTTSDRNIAQHDYSKASSYTEMTRH